MFREVKAKFKGFLVSIYNIYSSQHTSHYSSNSGIFSQLATKNANMALSVNKVKSTEFWDVFNIILVNYVEKGKTINGEYYVNLLDCSNDFVRQKHMHLVKTIKLSARPCTRANLYYCNGKIL